MTNLEYLQQRGCDPQTKNLRMGWICTIEINMKVKQFHGLSEKSVIRQAFEYAKGLPVEEPDWGA